MLRTRYQDGNILIDISCKKYTWSLKVDTGSPITILSLDDVSDILRVPKDNIVSYIRKNIKHSDMLHFKSYTGNNIDVIQCCLKDVIIGGQFIDCLYFMLNISSSGQFTGLLGLDFLSGCTGRLDLKCYIEFELIQQSKPLYDIKTIQVNNIEYSALSNVHVKNDTCSIICGDRIIDVSLPDII